MFLKSIICNNDVSASMKMYIMSLYTSFAPTSALTCTLLEHFFQTSAKLDLFIATLKLCKIIDLCLSVVCLSKFFGYIYCVHSSFSRVRLRTSLKLPFSMVRIIEQFENHVQKYGTYMCVCDLDYTRLWNTGLISYRRNSVSHIFLSTTENNVSA